MTYQPNPDAPIASEQHPELYERMCKARAFIEQVLSAYVKARKANGMTRPDTADVDIMQGFMYETIQTEFSINDIRCWRLLGEGILLDIEKLEQLIEENWK